MSVISRKNQVTIPVDVLRTAGMGPGDDVRVLSVEPGRIELVKADDLVDSYAGALGEAAYPAGYLEAERRGWE